jgi:hypothetical protein
MYKIVRNYFNGGHSKTIKSRLTLEEAQAHCKNPETSSRTCSAATNRRIGKGNGPWFDSYTECTR